MPNQDADASDSDFNAALDIPPRVKRERQLPPVSDAWQQFMMETMLDIKDMQFDHAEKISAHNMRIHANKKEIKKQAASVEGLEKTTKHLPLIVKSGSTLILGALTAFGVWIFNAMTGTK